MMRTHFEQILLALSVFFFMACVDTEFITESPTYLEPEIRFMSSEGGSSVAMVNLSESDSLLLLIDFINRRGMLDTNFIFEWISSDTSVLDVNESGQLIPVKVGMAKIIVTVYSEDYSHTDTLLVNVLTDESLFSIHAVTNKMDNIQIQDTLIFSAYVFSKVGDTILTKNISWVSSDESAVMINKEGIAIVLKSGEFEIYAETDGVVSKSIPIIVHSEGALLSPVVTIIPNNLNIKEGETFQYFGQYKDSLGHINENINWQWVSSSPDIARVDTLGNLTGVSPGFTTLLLTADDETQAIRHVEVVVNVNNISSVLVTTPKNVLMVGEKIQLEFDAKNSIGSDLLINNLDWNYSNDGILTIDSLGEVTGLEKGMTTVALRIDNVESNILQFEIVGNSKVGEFVGRIGSGYHVEGTGSFKLSDRGALEVVFEENFKSDNGPGLVVYLSKENTVTTTSLELGVLENIAGAQTYSVPNNVQLSDFGWIIIHCKPFNVVFGYAEIN